MQRIFKNKVLYILIVPLLLLLAGCGGGGNDKSDGGGSQPNEINVSYAGDVNITGNRLTMQLNFTEEPGKSPASGKVRMHDFHLTLSGSGDCRMEEVSYQPSEIDTYPSVLTIRGVFAPSSCRPENYTLQYKETITIDGHSKTTLKSVSGKLYPYGGPYTISVTPKELAVSEGGQSGDLTVQVLSNGQPATDVNVSGSLDLLYGKLDKYEGTTDSNGIIVFQYTAPDDIGSLEGKQASINLHLTQLPSVAASVGVFFGKQPPVDTTNLKLYASPKTIDISKAGDKRSIDLYLINDATHQPVEGVLLKAYAFDPNLGTLDRYEATTDVNGKATFDYTAPAPDLPKESFLLTFDVVNASKPIPENVVVNLQPIDTSRFRIYTVPDVVNVMREGESHNLDVYVEDTLDRSPVGGIVIKALMFDPKLGTLDHYTTTTDSNGKASFKYTAPTTLPTATSALITFSIVNGTVSKEANVTLHFEQIRYILDPDRNLTISQTNKGYTIHAALYRQKSDGTTEPAVGKTVVAEFLMPIYGSISQYESLVNSDGIATFQYTSPSRFVDLNDTNVTFHYKEDPTVSGKTKLLFRPENVDEVEHLYVIPSHIMITEPGQEKNITIVTVNGGNIGIPTTVDVEQPSNETDYGYFTPSGPVTTDASGRATLVYTAPDAIDRLTERNITFQVHDKKLLSQELIIDYDQGSGPGTRYEITVNSPNSLAVDKLDQITVIIHEYGNVDNVISDKDVHEVNLSSRFVNMLTFENNASTYSYSDYGTKAVAVRTKQISGTAVVDINASIFNGDHDVLIQGSYPVVILSGPVASISLFYASTSEDEELGIYKNVYTIHAVDKYDNPAQPGITLHPSIINGTKVIKSRSSSGKIVQTGSSSASFTDDTPNIFDSVDVRDLLAIIPNANRFSMEYVGNWSLKDVISSNKLELVEDYFGTTTNGLSYVIGNSHRYLPGYGVATVDIKDRDGKGFVTDENGNVQFEVTFDPVLAGHTVTLTATAYDGNRTGVAKVAELRWGEYSSSSKKIPNDGNDHTVTLSLSISGGLEHLIDLDIVPSSIVTSSGQCWVTNAPLDPNLHTDENGQITVTVHTEGSDAHVKECTVQWSATQGGIYMEY
ncbi:hypothetical protein [Nitratifractor sp.]